MIFANRAARELLAGHAGRGAGGNNSIEPDTPLWQLLSPLPEEGGGAEQSAQRAQHAVHAGHSVTLACHAAAASWEACGGAASAGGHSLVGAAAASAPTVAGPSTPMTSSSRMASSGSTASWDDVERVLTGHAGLDTLLGSCHAAACGSSSQPPQLSVTLTCAAAPDCRGNHPAMGIPAANAPWSGVGGQHSARACADAAPSPTSAAAPGRLWFAHITRIGGGPPTPLRASSNTSSSGGGSGPPGLAAAVGVDHLRPQEMADLQLGPMLGAGASGRWERTTKN